MKRSIAILLTLCILFLFTGCENMTNILDNESKEAEELLSGEENVEYAMSDGTTIEPETIVDTDGVVARVVGIQGTTVAPSIEMVFNKGTQDVSIDFVMDYILVDGWEVSGEIFPPSDAYMLVFRNWSRSYTKFSGEISIGTYPLTDLGLLDAVHEIEIGYTLLGESSSKEIASGIWSTTTSAAGEISEFTCDGPVLLEEDGISIQLMTFENYIDQLGEECGHLILYVENNSDRWITVKSQDSVKLDRTESEEEKDEENEDEEEEESTHRVIPRGDSAERNDEAAVPLPLEHSVWPGAKRLVELETSSAGTYIMFSEDEMLSFSLNVYDHEEYESASDEATPLTQKTITLSVEGGDS